MSSKTRRISAKDRGNLTRRNPKKQEDMSKYIDADKLKAEIERYKKGAAIARFDNAGENADYFQGKVDMCDDLMHIITSLQQEQPDTDGLYLELADFLTKNDVPEEKAKFLANRIADIYGSKKYLEGLCDGIKQDQPEVDLDALVNEAFDKYSSVDGYGQLSVSFNRAELYSFIKKLARKEG